MKFYRLLVAASTLRSGELASRRWRSRVTCRIRLMRSIARVTRRYYSIVVQPDLIIMGAMYGKKLRCIWIQL